jgi:hypothetical protein
VTGETIPAVQTSQIYKGSIAFIILQLIMVAAVIAFPQLVTGGIEKTVLIDADKALEQMQTAPRQSSSSNDPATGTTPAAGTSTSGSDEKEDPMKGLLESLKDDQKKK